MKRFLLLLMACATMFASCQKDADLAMESDGGMVDVTVSATMEGTSATTRATTVNYGDGKTVDRCIMEVYLDDGTLYKRMVVSDDGTGDSEITTETDGTRKVIFNLRLVADQTYDFLFWADKDNDDSTNDTESYYGEVRADGQGDKHYKTIGDKGLKAVTADYTNTAYDGNDETRDAFFGSESKYIDASVAFPVILKRPFGQLNVSTALTDVPSDMYPAKVQIEYTLAVCTTLNVLDGETDSSKTEIIKWNEAKDAIDYSTYKSGDMHLSTDYIFAPYYDTDADPVVVKQQLVDFKMTFIDAAGTPITTNDNFKSIPIQRNYRTNVSGELLTKQGTITVTIDPDFDDSPITVGVYEVASVDDIAAIVAKATEDTVYIKVAQDTRAAIDAENTYYVYFTNNNNVDDLTIEFTNVSENTNIYIGGDSDYKTVDAFSDTSTTYDGTLNVITGKDADNNYIEINSLYIYADEAHVTYTGLAASGNVNTSGTTFVLVDDSKIGTLTVEGGNVEVYGTVGDGDGDGDGTSNDDGIIISATNTTTKTIGIYGTVDSVTPADGYPTSSGDASIAITIYEGGEVTEPVNDTYFDVTYEVMEASDAASFATAMTYAETINLTGSFTLDKAYTISSAKSINGKNNTITMSGTNNITCSADMDIDSLLINATTNVGYAPIVINTAEVSFTMSNSTLTQNTAGTYAGSANNGLGIMIAGSVTPTATNPMKNVNVTLDNSTILLNASKYQRGIVFFDNYMEGSTLTLKNNSSVKSYLTGTTDVTTSMGICLGGMTNGEINIKDSSIEGVAYAVLIFTVGPEDAMVNIDNSTLSGYAAIYTMSNKTTYNITNNSRLVGRNNESGYYYFAAIVDENASGNIFNIENSTIVADMYNVGIQYAIQLTDTTGTSEVNLMSGTILESNVYDGTTGVADMYIKHSSTTKSKFTRDLSVVLQGSNSSATTLCDDFIIGKGIDGDPYLIYDDAELFMISDYTGFKTSDAEFYHYKQMRDLTYNADLTDDYGGTALAYPLSKVFSGVYDGNYCSITGFNATCAKITSDTFNLGLFGRLLSTGVVKNLTAKSSVEDGEYDLNLTTYEKNYTLNVGSIVGLNEGTVENCHSDLKIYTNYAKSDSGVGGIVGATRSSTAIDKTWMGVNIKIPATEKVSVNNCSFTGEISSSTYGGHMVGYADLSSYTTLDFAITNNDCDGSVTATSSAGYEYGYMNQGNATLDLDGNTYDGTISQQ